MKPTPYALTLILCIAVAALSPLASHAQVDGSWKVGQGSGNWSTSTNWVGDPSPVPGGIGSNVTIATGTGGTLTLTIDTTSRTVGILNTGSSIGSTININASGGASLTFDNDASNAQWNILPSAASTTSIGAPVTLTSTVVVDNPTTFGASMGGVVSGGGGVVKNGSGALSLTNGANTFSGSFTLNAGTAMMSHHNGLGTGAKILNGGWIRTTTSGDRWLPGALTLNGAIQFATGGVGSNQRLIFAGATGTVASDSVLNVIGDTRFHGDLGGTGSITKNGAYRLFLGSGSAGANNTFSGGFILNEGSVDLASTATATYFGSGTLTLNGGVLVSSGNQIIDNNVEFGPAVGLNLSTNTYSTTHTFTGGISLAADSLVSTGTATSLGGNATLSNVITDGGNHRGITKTGASTLTLGNDNTYSGGFALNQGTLTLSGAGTVTGQLGAGLFLIQGGALNSSTGRTIANEVFLNGDAILNSSFGSLVLNGAGTLSGVRTFSVTSTADVTLGGPIGDAGNANGLAKSGAGTGALVLAGNNSFSGATTLDGGTLRLSYGTNNGSKLSDSAALVLSSGTLDLAGGSHVEEVGSTTIGAGTTAITRGSGSAVLNLNTITRQTGGVVNFFSADGTARTDNTNTNGILGGWAHRGNDWAFNSTNADDGPIHALASYTSDTWAAGNNTTVTTSSSPASDSTTNSLRFGAVSANTVSLSGDNTITSGGILVSTAVGSNLSTISGGTLRGAAGTDLVVIQRNTSGALDIASQIVDNSGATGLTKSGGGVLLLSGANSYTGVTRVNEGTLRIGAAERIADSSRLAVARGATFDLNGFAETVAGLEGAGTVTSGAAGTVALAAGAGNFSTTFSGVIQNGSGTVGLTKQGSGTLTLTGTNTYTGATTISSGTLEIGSGSTTGALAAGTTITNDGTLAVNRIDSITLANAIGGSGAFSQIGMGTTTLSGSNSFSGATTVSNGALVLNYATNNDSKLSDSSALNFAGGNLDLAGGSHSEVVGSAALQTGHAWITRSSGTSVLNLNTITRSVGATLQTTHGITTTDNTNTNGILGGWAIIAGIGTSGTPSWAFNSTNGADGPINALAGASYAINTWSAGNNTTVTASNSPAAGSTTNSLRFAADTTGQPVTVTLSGTNTITSGGILVAAETSTGDITITGGSLRGAAGADLIVHQFNPLARVLIGSAIEDNSSATALTFNGITNSFGVTSALVLSGSNSYTGGTFINGGILEVGNGGTSGQLGSGTVSNLGTLLFNRSDALAVSNTIEGRGQVVQTGAGTTTLGGTNTFTGGIAINNGAIALGSAGALGASGTITLGGGTLIHSAANTTDYSARFSQNPSQQYRVDTNGQSLTWQSSLTSIGGELHKSGSGTLALPVANTYSGGSTVSGGTLLISHNLGLGHESGAAEVVGAASAILRINTGITVANDILFSNTNGASAVLRGVAAGNPYTVGTSGTLRSDFVGGYPDTAATLLASANASSSGDLTMRFSELSAATNDGQRLSDVFSLSGTGSDIFVLQLSIPSVTDANYLGWLNGSNLWVNAIDGNSAVGGSAIQGYLGSFAASGASATTAYLGSWGVDTGAGSVWAVLDHNSDFAVIPEPSSVLLLGLGLAAVLLRRRNARS